MDTKWKTLIASTDAKLRFLYWLKCREEARIGKMLYDEPPYTDDPILGKYKFCNVNREHDAVTVWVKENIRDNPRLLAEKTPHLMVMNLAIARLFNHPETLHEIGFPLMSVAELQGACDRAASRKERGDKMLRGAYLVTPHGAKNKGVRTSDYVAKIVGGLVGIISPFKHFLGLSEIAEEMLKAYGWQAFMVNQICTDLRYTPWFKDAPDWETFVLAGPGTRRGVNRYNGAVEREDVYSTKGGQAHYISEILSIREDLRKLPWLGKDILDALCDPNNLSNCFCEFDKFERAKALADSGKTITLKHYKG